MTAAFSPGLKRCSHCKQLLPFDLFTKASNNIDGLTYRCKSCIAEPIKQKRKAKTEKKKQEEKLKLESLTHKMCSLCGKEKPVSAFFMYNGYKYRNKCKPCSNLLNNKRRREVNLKLKFNISSEEYETMVINQQHQCAICGISDEELSYSLAVDHDHTTGAVRSLLCAHCNLLLGNAKDSINILKAAIKYLRSHSIHTRTGIK